jgi:hypothetical protein
VGDVEIPFERPRDETLLTQPAFHRVTDRLTQLVFGRGG